MQFNYLLFIISLIISLNKLIHVLLYWSTSWSIILLLMYYISFIPFPYYSGMISIQITIDNGNIAFELLLIILYPIIYWINGFESKTIKSCILFILIIIINYLLFTFTSLLLFFICYELLLIILSFILFLFIPSYYRIRTAFFFSLFSIFGSLLLLISLIIFISTSFIITLLLIIPFIIKLPSFPFYYWLPEVHCEVNSSISLLLAGISLKLSIYGILRFIFTSFYISCRFISSFFISFSLIGIIIVCCSCFRYFDLKKIIALSSIIHLNTAFISIYSLSSIGILSTIIISLSHSISSITLFLLTGLVINKTYSRYLDSLFFINSILRGTLLLFILCNLSFPGSINFISELIALIAFYSIDYLLIILFIYSSFLSTFIWFIIYNKKLPYHSCYSLYIIHYMLFILFIIIIYIIGLFTIVIDQLVDQYIETNWSTSWSIYTIIIVIHYSE